MEPTTAGERARLAKTLDSSDGLSSRNRFARRLIAHVEELEAEKVEHVGAKRRYEINLIALRACLETAEAELEKARELVKFLTNEVHRGYCEQDGEGQWSHHPGCGDGRTFLATEVNG